MIDDADRILLQRALVRRLPGLAFGDLWRSLGKVVVGTAVMTAMVALGWQGLARSGLAARTADFVALVGLIPLGVAAYGLLLWWLRIEGRDDLRAMVAKVATRLTGASRKSAG